MMHVSHKCLLIAHSTACAVQLMRRLTWTLNGWLHKCRHMVRQQISLYTRQNKTSLCSRYNGKTETLCVAFKRSHVAPTFQPITSQTKSLGKNPLPLKSATVTAISNKYHCDMALQIQTAMKNRLSY